MTKVVVLGAGLMGRALAWDLCRQDNIDSVVVADVSAARIKETKKIVDSKKATYEGLDIENAAGLKKLLKGASLVFGAVSYQFNAKLTAACIAQGAHFIDLGGNDAIVDKQFALSPKAKEKGVTIFPDCGLAPGLAGILGMHVFRQFDTCTNLHLRVGGLPQHPKPPLNYMLVFSVHGLINEYKEPVRVISKNKLEIVPGMSGLEELEFPKPYGTLEAFYTSGGVSTLVKTLAGKVRELDYKTIRYPGHQEKIQFLMDMGFFDEKKTSLGVTPRDLTEALLSEKLNLPDKDLILIRVWGEGTCGRKKAKISFRCIDLHDERSGLTAMMRMTAFPAAIIGNMILKGDIKVRGVLRQEEHVPVPLLLKELTRRGIRFIEE